MTNYPTAGQPTKYKPEYCQMLIEHMAEGLSFKAFAGVIRVSRQTLYNWANKEHDSYAGAEWEEAIEIGDACEQLYWEKVGRDGMHGQVFITDEGKTIIRPLNTGVWALNVRNRLGWKDKIEVTTQGGDKPQRLVIEMGSDEEEKSE